MKEKILSPIKETTEDYERIEKKIIQLFLDELYKPLLKVLELKPLTIQNASGDLISAIRSGRITFYRGAFNGRFTSSVSKELKELGAKWDRTQGTWKIPQSSLPLDVREAISASAARMSAKIAGVDKVLADLVPEKIADQLKVSKFFDTALWKVEKDFKKSIAGITIGPPDLTKEQKKKISDEWSSNLKLWIKDWTENEIKKLRVDVQESALKGNRFEVIAETLQKSYGQSQNKAKFLARQETSLMMTKFKETRYLDAGSEEYIWGCVAGSKNHPVRPFHKALEGKRFSWKNPPVTDQKGSRNNPGQDYNCRCFAKPVVKFK